MLFFFTFFLFFFFTFFALCLFSHYFELSAKQILLVMISIQLGAKL